MSSSEQQKKKECQVNNTEHDNVTVPPNNQYIYNIMSEVDKIAW